MARSDGSAAVAHQAAPQSAVVARSVPPSPTDAQRRQLRSDIRHLLEEAQESLDLARAALNGPDAEAAIPYLTFARDEIRTALSTGRGIVDRH